MGEVTKVTPQKTPGPKYYALADGRQLYELFRDEIVPSLSRLGMSAWDIHALTSAMEHRFRMGAKPGEEETDRESCSWWVGQMSWGGIEIEANRAKVFARIDEERKRVGR